MPVNPHSSLQAVGFTPGTPVNLQASTALSATANWLAYSFNLPNSLTVNKVRVRASAVGGTLAATDLTCDIYNDASGVPGTSQQSTATVTATPAGAAWVEFTGFTFAATAGTQYWLVLKNANGTPATNFPTYIHGSSFTGATGQFAGGNSLWGSMKLSSTNSGGTWGTPRTQSCGWRLEMSDGSFWGEPVETMAQVTAATGGAYLTREAGVTFVSPPNAAWNVRGLAFPVARVGSPAGNLRFRLYNGTTLLATSNVVLPANVATTVQWVSALFAANQVIYPGTTVRATMGTTTGGDSSNCYSPCEYTINNDANSKALFPFATAANPTNGVKKTYFDGSSWADTDTVIEPFALLLDSDGEFGSLGRGLVVAA